MSSPTTAVKVTYTGKHPDLIDGKLYTFKEITDLTGVTDNLLRYRLDGSNTCTDFELRKSGETKTNKSRKKAHTMTCSQKWLKKSLV